MYLFIPTADTNGVLAFVDDVSFGAAFNGVSFGRYPNGSGRLTQMSSLTLGGRNALPRFGPLIISEVNYHPGEPSAAALAVDPTLVSSDLEFVEIYSAALGSTTLDNWRLRGEVDFDFDPGTTLDSGETLTIISFNPSNVLNDVRLAAFRAEYGIGSEVMLVGGYSGHMNNSEGSVRLERPDEPSASTPTIYPHVVEDELFYDDLAPWPTATDGGGLH